MHTLILFICSPALLQALINDLLDLKLNRVTIESEPKEGGTYWKCDQMLFMNKSICLLSLRSSSAENEEDI